MPRRPSQLKIMHLNVQSISNKLKEIQHHIATEEIDILSLNETWLKPSQKLKMPNYSLVRKDRPSQPHGGVLLAIHKDILYEPINLPGEEEIVAVKLLKASPEGENITVVSLYNPPDKQVPIQTLKNILQDYCNVLIVGDLNGHHEYWNSRSRNVNGRLICDLIFEENLSLLNNDSPTYEPLHNPEYKVILDLALASEFLFPHVADFQVSDEVRSDHLPFTILINSGLQRRSPIKPIEVKTTNWLNFKSEMKSNTPSPAEPINSISSLDSVVCMLTEAMQKAVSDSTTVKEIHINSNKPLILPPYIVKLIKEKRKARRKHLKTRDPTDKTNFNRLTAKVKLEINNYDRNKWQNHCSGLNALKTSDTKLWRALDAIDSSKPPRTSRPPVLRTNDGSLSSDPAVTANLLADHLERVFTDPGDPSFDPANFDNVNEAAPYLFTSPFRDQEAELITPEEVSNTIRDCVGTHGAPGLDGLTNKALKNLPNSTHQLLALIFNASLNLSYIPKSWKLAVVVMIPKPNKDHTLPCNFRPISLLATLLKLLERLMLRRLLQWIESIDLISTFQSGFRKHRQTKDQIIRLLQDTVTAFNKKQCVGTVLIDIEMAFDRVWHQGLLFKLDRDGVPNYMGKWIQNYLAGRSFQVRCSKTLSSTRQIETGVPQGSVLGPILFVLFFNDLVKPNPTPFEPTIALFADDVAIWVASRSIEVIRMRLQKQLDQIEEWMSTWRTKLSVTKTVYTVFNKSGRNTPLDLKYNEQQLNYERNPKFLGITLDPSLCFNKHATDLAIRAHKRINMLRRIKGKSWGASTSLILTTYKVLVRPILEYAPFLLLTMAPTNQLKLERVQRAAVRVATFWPPHTSTKTMYEQVSLVPLIDRAYSLTDNYICRALANNPLISNLINSYKSSAELDDGAHIKPESRRTTILGIIAANKELRCNQLPLQTELDSSTEEQATEFMGMRGIQISRSSPLLDPGDPGAIV